MKRFNRLIPFLILFMLAYLTNVSENQSSIKEETMVHFISSNQFNKTQTILNQQSVSFLHSFNNFYTQIYLLIKKAQQALVEGFFMINNRNQVSKPVNYKDNFASISGGAQILMISSDQVMSPKSILDSNPDTYLYTDDSLPITIVIGLTQQVMLDTFILKSGEVYSRITKDFILEGSFSLGQDTEWTLLGNLTAENSFEKQPFHLQHTIIKYLKITIISTYGSWKYFSLTQIQVFGEGLFTHALQTLVEANIKQRQALKKQLIQNKSQENITSQQLEEKLQDLVEESMEEFQSQAHTLVYNLINHKIPFSLPNQIHQTPEAQSQKHKRITKKEHQQNIQLIQFEEDVDELQNKLSKLQKTNQKLQLQIKQLKELYFKNIQISKPVNSYQGLQFYLILLSFFTSFICIIVLVMVQITRKKQANVIQQKKREMYKQIALQKVALIVKQSSLFKQFASQKQVSQPSTC